MAAFAAFGAQRAKAAVRLSDTQTQLSKLGPTRGCKKKRQIPASLRAAGRHSPGLHKQQCVEWTSPQLRRTPTLFGVASLHRLPSSQIRCSSTWHRFAEQRQSLRTSLHEPPRATLLHGRTAGPRTGQARQAQNRAAGCGGRQKAESRSAACARSSSTITALHCIAQLTQAMSTTSVRIVTRHTSARMQSPGGDTRRASSNCHRLRGGRAAALLPPAQCAGRTRPARADSRHKFHKLIFVTTVCKKFLPAQGRCRLREYLSGIHSVKSSRTLLCCSLHIVCVCGGGRSHRLARPLAGVGRAVVPRRPGHPPLLTICSMSSRGNVQK